VSFFAFALSREFTAKQNVRASLSIEISTGPVDTHLGVARRLSFIESIFGLSFQIIHSKMEFLFEI
jgi:hypothetical protein